MNDNTSFIFSLRHCSRSSKHLSFSHSCARAYGASDVAWAGTMCDAIFTFGQRGSHFFQCPSRRDYTRLPKKLVARLTATEVRKLHHVTLGFEDSFLLVWRDDAGYDRIDSDGLPDELIEFLYAKNPQGQLIRNLSKFDLTLGPYNASFYVTDGPSCLWMNLPPLLLNALQARIKNGSWTDKPRIVALGAQQNFLLVTDKNAAVWDLRQYETLSKMLEFSRTRSRGIEEVQGVALHAYRYQCFVAQSRNGTVLCENLPPHEVNAVQAMQASILQDTQEAEKAKERERKLVVERRPSLKPAASMRREFGDGGARQEFRAQKQAHGLRLSLSMSISARGLAGGFGFGKMLG